MVTPSVSFAPVLLKAMTVHPEDPFKFDFVVDSGNTDLSLNDVQAESRRLVKYFLASMTIPQGDLWVNLSPYENDRIVPEALGNTDLGRDLLAQDYLLKQFTSSLIYPEKELGRKFWDAVYAKAQEKFGTTQIPANTFNKVWILPEKATIFQKNTTVYIVRSKLKVMLDRDYRAMSHAGVGSKEDPAAVLGESILREIVLPEIEKEVNEGKNFAPLRQIYQSLILAKWYKETIKKSLLAHAYVDQQKVSGVEVDEIDFKERIYAQYVKAYEQGVYNYIKEEFDVASQEVVPRKYFSGGFQDAAIVMEQTSDASEVEDSIKGDNFTFTLALEPVDPVDSPDAVENLVTQKLIGVKNTEVERLIEELKRRPEIARTLSVEEAKRIAEAFIPGKIASEPDFKNAFPDFIDQLDRVKQMIVDDRAVVLHEIDQTYLKDTFLLSGFSFIGNDGKLHIYYITDYWPAILHEIFEQLILVKDKEVRHAQRHTLSVLAELGLADTWIMPRVEHQLELMNFRAISGFFRGYGAALEGINKKFNIKESDVSDVTIARNALAKKFAKDLHLIAKAKKEKLGSEELSKMLIEITTKALADDIDSISLNKFFKDFWPVIEKIGTRFGKMAPDLFRLKNTLAKKMDLPVVALKSEGELKAELIGLAKSLEGRIPGLEGRITEENIEQVAFDLYHKAAVVRTGGTLEMAGTEGRNSKRAAIDRIVDMHVDEIGYSELALPELPDSSNVGREEWNVIVRRVTAVIETKRRIGEILGQLGREDIPRPGGVIVTCGTDTADQIGFVLSLALPRDMYVPVALTAAAVPWGQKDSDVNKNFSLSLQVVSDPDIPPLSYFVYNNIVHLSSRIKKFIAGDPLDQNTRDLLDDHRDFESYGDIVADKEGDDLDIDNWTYILYLKRLFEEGAGKKEFRFDNVEHIVITGDTPVEIVKSTADRLLARISGEPQERAGLIIQGRQSDNVSPEDIARITAEIKRLIEHKIPVFVGSRELAKKWGGSGVMLLPKYFYFAKARQKLAWLLSQNVAFEDIEEQMNTDQAGELSYDGISSLWDDFPQSHVYEHIDGDSSKGNNFKKGQEVVPAYPNIKLDVYVDSINRLKSVSGPRALVIYGFGDGNLPLQDASLGDPDDPQEDAPVKRGLQKEFPALVDQFLVNLKKVKDESEPPPLDNFESAMMRTLSDLPLQELQEILSRYKLMDVDTIVDRLVGEKIKEIIKEKKFPKKTPSEKILPLLIGAFSGFFKGADVKTVAELETVLRNQLRQPFLKGNKGLYLKDLARRVIKDSLMAANPILKELGSAIDVGIEVKVLTTAVRSKSNNRTYGLGNLLFAVGANSRMHHGWESTFLPKKDASQASDLGGIDMNQISLDRQGGAIEGLEFDDQGWDTPFTGFSPVISDLTPINGALLLLQLGS